MNKQTELIHPNHLSARCISVCGVFLVCLLMNVEVKAQLRLPSNERTLKLTKPYRDTVLLDSLTVFQHDFRATSNNGTLLPKTDYILKNNILVFITKPQGDSLTLKFRVMPYAFSAPFSNNRISISQSKRPLSNLKYKLNEDNSTNLFSSSGFDYSGSFSRGLTAGNNQNLVLNSAFNIQFNGKLGDDIEVMGALTDNSLPIQAEGNTQQLQEFDKIFIQIKRKNLSLLGGDFELKRPAGSYFTNYLRKSQGAMLEIVTPENTKDKNASANGFSGRAGAGLARGKFSRNVFQGIEGNQGPYRLSGAEGERFIIILSGTERIYIDGVLLARGLDRDYIINYNTGELTFTPNRMITKDIRIQVEFSYVEQSYVRSHYILDGQYKMGKLTMKGSLFSEQDNGNQPSAQSTLTDVQRAILEQSGDKEAILSSIDTTSFNLQRVSYRLADTTVNGITYDSVLVYSTNANVAIYKAQFNFVGAGNGHYSIATSSANGRVYKWSAPDASGKLSGSYEPISKLVTPRSQRLYGLGASYQLGKEGEVSVEGALSEIDLNTLSEKNDEDNLGYAVKVDIAQKLKLAKSASDVKKEESYLSYKAHYELVQSRFQYIEPFRPREFGRDWNTNAITQKTQEHLGQLELKFLSKLGLASYEFSTLQKESFYSGIKHSLGFVGEQNGWGYNFLGSYLNTSGSQGKSEFLRPKIELKKRIDAWKKLTIGVYFEQEKNEIKNPNMESLAVSSFQFDIYRAFVELPENNKITSRIEVQRRDDKHAPAGQLRLFTVGEQISWTGNWTPKPNQNLKWNATWRRLDVKDTLGSDQKPQETFLGRGEYNQTNFKGALVLNTILEAGSGQQRKVEFTYLKVNPGEGTYQWIDRNSDSIPQLNEFEVAAFRDQALYSRVVNFTDQFIRTQNIQLSQSIRIEPRLFWAQASKGSAKYFWSKFSLQTVLSIERNTAGVSLGETMKLWEGPLTKVDIIAFTGNVRNSLFFNRSNPKFGLEVNQVSLKSKQQITGGYELRGRDEWLLKARYNPLTHIGTQLQASYSAQDNDSEQFNERDYRFIGWKLEPQLSWQPNRKFRLTTSFAYKTNANRINNKESLNSSNATLEATFNQAGKTDLRAKFSLVQNEFTGQNNTAISFALLEGLQPGRNLVWNLTLRRALSNFIELTLSYDGRQAGEKSNMVHTGQAQIRATF